MKVGKDWFIPPFTTPFSKNVTIIATYMYLRVVIVLR